MTNTFLWASVVAQLVKNPPANAGDLGSIPGGVFLPRESHGQRSLADYSTKSQTGLSTPMITLVGLSTALPALTPLSSGVLVTCFVHET